VKQAAKFSMCSVPIAIVVNIIGSGFANKVTALGIIFPAVAGILVLAGLVLGIVALIGMRKHGSKGILLPAILGTILNFGVIVLSMIGLFVLTAKAERVKALLETEKEIHSKPMSDFR
jgi:hypothetical protein